MADTKMLFPCDGPPAAGMTADEIAVLDALAGARFIPGTAAKRFIRTTTQRDRSKPMTEAG